MTTSSIGTVRARTNSSPQGCGLYHTVHRLISNIVLVFLCNSTILATHSTRSGYCREDTEHETNHLAGYLRNTYGSGRRYIHGCRRSVHHGCGMSARTRGLNASTYRPTRFAGLGYEKHGHGLWRMIDTSTGNAVGYHYETKAELLADLERYARKFMGVQA
jgi:hypothetical protein